MWGRAGLPLRCGKPRQVILTREKSPRPRFSYAEAGYFLPETHRFLSLTLRVFAVPVAACPNCIYLLMASIMMAMKALAEFV